MALIKCPECGKEVSTSAKSCPSCGYPVAEKTAEVAAQAGTPVKSDELLLEVRQSWWGYFWYWFFFFLIIPPLIAWFKRSAMVVRIYSGRITIERGVFSKCYQDYIPRDIRSVDVDQSFGQRIVGIGDITISTAATVDAAEKIESVPDPKGIRELILAQRANQ
jgi:hypothetical protein